MMDGSVFNSGLTLYVPPNEEHQRRLMAWAENIVPGAGIETATGFGVIRGERLIAAVFYSNWNPPHFCDIGVVSTDPRFMSRRVLHHAFSIPFMTWGVRRLGSITSRKNKKARRLLEKLGFKLEGIARQGWKPGGDAAVYSMLPHECRWIREGR